MIMSKKDKLRKLGYAFEGERVVGEVEGRIKHVVSVTCPCGEVEEAYSIGVSFGDFAQWFISIGGISRVLLKNHGHSINEANELYNKVCALEEVV